MREQERGDEREGVGGCERRERRREKIRRGNQTKGGEGEVRAGVVSIGSSISGARVIAVCVECVSRERMWSTQFTSSSPWLIK